jgi:hypothetical protein
LSNAAAPPVRDPTAPTTKFCAMAAGKCER